MWQLEGRINNQILGIKGLTLSDVEKNIHVILERPMTPQHMALPHKFLPITKQWRSLLKLGCCSVNHGKLGSYVRPSYKNTQKQHSKFINLLIKITYNHAMTHTKENKGTLTSDLISVRLNVCFCIVVSKLHISQITQCTQEVLEIESLKSLNK